MSRLGGVLVIQTWGIGDLIMTTPMLQALHTALPDARIDVVAGLTSAAEVLRGATYANVRGIIRRQHGLPRLVRFFASLRSSRYDAAIVATRISPRMGQMARYVAGIPVVVGDGTGSRPLGYSAWRRVDLEQHRVEGNIELARQLVDLPSIPPPRFEITPAAAASAAERWRALDFGDRPVLALHPGSSHASASERRIPDTLLQAILSGVLAGAPQAGIMVILGPEEQDLAPRFAGLDPRVRILSQASLQETGWMLARCRTLVAGDSGLGHVAAAVGTAVVTLAGPTQTKATRPWGKHTSVIRTREVLPCMPCYDTPLYGHCPYDVRCLKTLSPDDALSPILRSLGGDPPPRD